MKRIAVATVARSDWGMYRPVLQRIRESPALELEILAGGSHLAQQFGMTVDEIGGDGFEVAERVEMVQTSDSPAAAAKAIGLGVIGFADVYARRRPDLLLALGDRFEMLAAVAAALPFAIPVAHIGGGEATEGLIDESIRHSISKMSHIHFAATEPYAARLMRMGEERWRIHVTGAPALDNIAAVVILGRSELAARFGLGHPERYLLATFHPVTLEPERTEEFVGELLAALDEVEDEVVFTYPNADPGFETIVAAVEEFAATRTWVHVAVNSGTQLYFSLMAHARAMVGNSSSGIIEAASFRLPVVNVGDRQRGRIHGANVLDVPCERRPIIDALRRATSDEFRASLESLVNMYGDGKASERIVNVLEKVELGRDLLLKRFADGDES